MDIDSLAAAFQWVIAHGYTLMFLAMVIEGPIITTAAALAAAAGFFNIFAVFFLAISGDLVADSIYYAIGRWGRSALVNRFGHWIGISRVRMKKAEAIARKHDIKALILLKFTPILVVPGLMLMGVVKMSYKKFILYCLAITTIKVIFFVIVGYYFGYLFKKISDYIDNAAVFLLGLLLFGLIIYIIYARITVNIASKVEKI